MNHPELMLVPMLMLSDHLLTVAGARAREKGYSQHIRTEHYELNPIWQAEIARKRWFNPRHLFLVVLVGSLLFAVGEYEVTGDDPTLAFATGMLLSAFGTINGRHLANLATFRRVQHHSTSDIDGSITFSHEYVLSVSLYQQLALLLPMALLCLFSPTPPLLGGVAGIVLLMLLHAAWIARWRRRSAKQDGNQADSATSPSSSVSATKRPCPSSSANRPPRAISSS